MKIRRRMFAVLSVTCGAMASAWGAHLPSRPAPVTVLSAPTFNWTGIYFGINGGGGWGAQQPLNLITNAFDGKSVDLSGGVFGGTAGAQIQTGHVVIGFETDLDWTGLKGSSTFVPSVGGIPVNPAAISATTKIEWEATARARVGYAEQNWLFYATGGLAILGTNASFTPPAGVGCSTFLTVNCSGSKKQIGGVVGDRC